MNHQFITPNGLQNLGRLLVWCRLRKGWSHRVLSAVVESHTGVSLSPSQISNLENGKHVPSWDTLTQILSPGHVIDPKTQEPLTQADLFKIACESKIVHVPPFKKSTEQLSRRGRFRAAEAQSIYAHTAS